MSAAQQQQLSQQSLIYRAAAGSRPDGLQAQATRPNLTPDDFPALSGTLGSNVILTTAFGASTDLAPGAGAVDHSLTLGAGADQTSALPNGLETTSAYKPPTTNLTKGASLVATQGPVSAADRFGLQGLLSINDYGFDISKFGIPLPSAGAVYPTFGSPWTDQAQAYGIIEPDFKLPSCYNASQSPPAVTRIQVFSEETLFYIFYTMPRDELQLVAAEELYRRQWRYHKELHLWLTKDPDTQPTARTPRGEQSVFIFFDPGVWQKVKKEFLVIYEMLEDRGAAMASGEPASGANFRAGAHSVPPGSQQYQGQGQGGMDQDGAAAAQAQLQNMLQQSNASASHQQQQQQQLMMLRQRQQQESAQAAAMAGQMGYSSAQMSDMNAAVAAAAVANSMYSAAPTGVRSLPPPHMEIPKTSAAGQPSSSSSNLAEDVATASMV
ncbi:transcriptional regulator [Coemansia sp. BCRC 34962]|nr:transcriptional regulator [Coemansia sp. BCRC 34962]